MFTPPRCPHPDCAQHLAPEGRFYVRRGFYWPKCRAHPIPRFRCRSCGRGFSRQTFRADYRDHRPDLNPRLFILLNSGIGQRQSARILGVSRRCLEVKFHKYARHARALNLNLRGPLPPGSSFQFDELETYEGRRNTRPLTVPLLIERDSRFVVWAESAPIRPRGKMTPARRDAIAREDKVSGRRRDQSHACIQRTLARGRELGGALSFLLVETDEKTVYPGHLARAFPGQRVVHLTTNSKEPRTRWNPLFPINHTDARFRDLMGRLRRDSWLGTKRGRYLDLHLQYHMSYLNYVRPRFNRDKRTPAERLGFLPRPLKPGEVLGWRQDWGRRSIHPLSRDGAWPVAELVRPA